MHTEYDLTAAERKARRHQEQRADDLNRPAWAVTVALLAGAVACYVAKALGIVSTPHW